MSKGEATRERIVDRAWRLASRDGLAGLSLQRLATDLGLSKSGLFAHFGSKQELELEVLKCASEHFIDKVIRPALKAPRGVPRLRQLFKNWISWANDPAVPGGCVFLAVATELDDSEGPQRDYLVTTQSALLATLAKAARLAIEEGHFRGNVDCEQFAFDLLGVVLAYHHARRLLRLPKAEARAQKAFDALLQAAQA
ncbi:MAG TPA: TetR/AcrR family transcriptional regulator [Polyangiaceae bacterium]|nr:TetR/AcrR family transcriptional regulator [Polyangiaceae bacterium]